MTNPYCGHCFPAEIISYCVWLYYTFPLSLRDIEKRMLYRGITVTYEAIRERMHNAKARQGPNVVMPLGLYALCYAL
ncbi:MAG: hypothetical protein AAFO84_17200, partial [Cyanobacteria bacterium J06598_1]